MLLTCVLALTPLRHALVWLSRRLGTRWGRRFSDWNWLVYLRRPLGLASFVYASAHLALYATLDLDLQWHEFVLDLDGKRFVLAGLAAFALLVPLAVTSTDAWMRRLKRNWKRVHWLVYPAALLAGAALRVAVQARRCGPVRLRRDHSGVAGLSRRGCAGGRRRARLPCRKPKRRNARPG